MVVEHGNYMFICLFGSRYSFENLAWILLVVDEEIYLIIGNSTMGISTLLMKRFI